MPEKTGKKDYILLFEKIVLISAPLILLLVQSVIAGKNLFISIPVWSDVQDTQSGQRKRFLMQRE